MHGWWWWRVELGRLPVAHQAALSFLSSRGWAEGENKVEKASWVKLEAV